MSQSNCSRLATLACLSVLPALAGATDPALIRMLVANGVLTEDQASSLEVSAPGTTDPALLALLVSNGVLSTAQADSLRAGPATARTAPAAAPAAPAAAPAVVVKPKEKSVQSLTISGRVQVQMDYLGTEYDNADAPHDEFNLFIRRIYLGASAKFAEGLSGTINANFGTDAAGVGEIEKAVVEYHVTPEHVLAVGFQKVPFAFEETTSSSKIPAVERSLATRYFTEQLDYGARHTGIYFSGKYDSGVAFTLAVTNPDQGTVSSSSATDTVAYWGRTSWSGKSGGVDLELGLNGGIIPDQRVMGRTDAVWGAFADLKFESFKFAVEYLAGRLEGARSGGHDASPQALRLLGIYKVSPALELVGQASFFDADGGIGADISDTFRRAPENGSARYDEAHALYLGGNWYIRGNDLKLSAGYEWAEYNDNLTGSQGDATVDGVRTRLQLLF